MPYFSYDSCLENQGDSIGVRFDDLHLCRYSSCVTDILYFLFTTVDCDVRRDHAFNFIAAYYDHFNKVCFKLYNLDKQEEINLCPLPNYHITSDL